MILINIIYIATANAKSYKFNVKQKCVFSNLMALCKEPHFLACLQHNITNYSIWLFMHYQYSTVELKYLIKEYSE